jgi:hypothetical protein
VRTVDRKLLERFVRMAGRTLSGDWVVIGGCVLPLIGLEHRVTVDIDIAGPEKAGQDQTLALMGIAEKLGLPIEAINQAGAYFLRRIKGWERDLVVVHEGPKARILRPNVTLFILLKVSRMSESDLSDCTEFLRLAGTLGEKPDRRRILEAIRRARRKSETEPVRERLEALEDALG